MPELPEVETVRLQLRRHIVGKQIASVVVHHQKAVAFDTGFGAAIIGRTVADIDRVGKLMILSFVGGGDSFILAHLKMTGQFLYRDARGVAGGGHSMTAADSRELPGRHTRVSFSFTDGSELFFNDMRLFGYTKRADGSAVAAAKAQYGPEYISDDFDDAWYVAALRKRKTSVKAALLDQSFASGLGNIYVDETLWRVGVRPTRKANRLTKSEALQLRHAASEIMKASIAVGGTTFQHFADTGGEAGNYTDYLMVFGKQGTACTRCGTTIKKTRVAGRGTHYCPGCQK